MGQWKSRMRRISGAMPPLKLSTAYLVRICAGIGLSLGILAPDPARATKTDTDTVSENSFDDRVDAVRKKLGVIADNPDTSVSGPELAQWYNWPNWQNSWNNWGNSWQNY